VVEWAGLESSLGSTGFDKMVDKDFETEKKGVWGDTAEWGGEKVVQQVILPPSGEARRLFSKSFRKN